MLSQSSWNVMPSLSGSARSRRRGSSVPVQHPFEHRDVGDLAAGREALAAVEDDVVALVADHHVVVARVHRAAEEPLVAGGLGLDGGDLLGCADQPGRPEPQVVVAEQLADRAVGRRRPRGSPGTRSASPGPPPPCSTGPSRVTRPASLSSCDLGVRGGAGAVALGGVGGEDRRPPRRRGRSSPSLDVVGQSGLIEPGVVTDSARGRARHGLSSGVMWESRTRAGTWSTRARHGSMGGASGSGHGGHELSGAGADAACRLRLQLADDRQDVLAEVLDLLLEVQEAEQEQVHAAALVLDDAVGDLLRRADQLGAEAVVVLDEVLERGVRPHALACRRSTAPACWTASRKPSTACLLALAMISRSVSRASSSVSRAMMKPLSPNFGGGRAGRRPRRARAPR